MRLSWISIGFAGSFIVMTAALRWLSVDAALIGSASIALFLILLMLGLKRSSTALLFLSAFSGCLLAIIRVDATTHITSPQDIESIADGRSIELHGIIVSAPDVRDIHTKYTLSIQSVIMSGSAIPMRGKVLVSDYNGYPDYEYGDDISAYGKLQRPGNIDGFAYDDYLSIWDIYAIMNRASIQELADPADRITPGSKAIDQHIYRSLLTSKTAIQSRIKEIFPEPHASLLIGLLTGDRGTMPEHLLEVFRVTGLSHIIAISGYNITIIITLLSSALFWLPLKRRFIPLIIGIIAFTLFTGAGASVVRAAIMGIVGLIALQHGRLKTTHLTVLWTAFFMVLFNPKYLWFDVGFQLSFLAVIGIALFAKTLEKWLGNLTKSALIRESLTVTLAAQIGTLPLSIFTFGQLSLIGPVANLLVAPLIPFAMLFGAITIMISVLSFTLAQWVGLLTWGCLELVMGIAELLGRILFASVPI